MLKKIALLLLPILLISSSIHTWEDDREFSWGELEARNKKPQKGPPGPSGPPGPPGNVVSNYASCFGYTQTVGENTPIQFHQDQTTPRGVNHPVGGNEACFQVTGGGIYHISWSLSASNSVDDFLTMSLVNLSSSQPFQAAPQSAATLTANTTQILSGQTIVALPANTLFEMQATSRQKDAKIAPTLTILRIAQ